MAHSEGQLTGESTDYWCRSWYWKSDCLAFAQEGAQVAVHVNRSLENGLRVVDEIQQSKGKAILVQGDLTKQQEIKSVVEKVTKEFWDTDILVYNSGIGTQRSTDMVHTITEEDWDAVLSVNLKAFFLSQLLLPAMIRLVKAPSSPYLLSEVYWESRIGFLLCFKGWHGAPNQANGP